MPNTIDMQDMRYLNLFTKVTMVQTRYCFKYNEMLIFCVPKAKLSLALGRDASNLRRLSEILRKRVRVIPFPRGVEDARFFIETIVKPVGFKDLEVTPTEIIINAGSQQSKALLMGRNKKRLIEMQGIIKDYFSREFRII
jgi:transcription antitermination factor NusA-like protein